MCRVLFAVSLCCVGVLCGCAVGDLWVSCVLCAVCCLLFAVSLWCVIVVCECAVWLRCVGAVCVCCVVCRVLCVCVCAVCCVLCFAACHGAKKSVRHGQTQGEVYLFMFDFGTAPPDAHRPTRNIAQRHISRLTHDGGKTGGSEWG